jgi:hypothetical protein
MEHEENYLFFHFSDGSRLQGQLYAGDSHLESEQRLGSTGWLC